jgi:hypothetical protein
MVAFRATSIAGLSSATTRFPKAGRRREPTRESVQSVGPSESLRTSSRKDFPTANLHVVERRRRPESLFRGRASPIGGIEMDEIIQRLVEKTGLPEDKARAAVDTVVGFLKEKLPAPVASQIDNLLTGETGLGAKLGGMAQGLGGMFSRKE